MLVDSGASDSSIRGDVADRLGLRVLGLFSVTGFANRASTIQHLADIELWLGDVSYPLSGWKLMRFESDYDKIDGILGRDILERGRFVLDGPAHQFTLEF